MMLISDDQGYCFDDRLPHDTDLILEVLTDARYVSIKEDNPALHALWASRKDAEGECGLLVSEWQPAVPDGYSLSAKLLYSDGAPLALFLPNGALPTNGEQAKRY